MSKDFNFSECDNERVKSEIIRKSDEIYAKLESNKTAFPIMVRDA